MTQQTGPAVFKPDGSHTHTVPAPAPVPPATPPFLPAETAIGRGAWATAWATAILDALGAPASAVNIASLISWFAAEDNNGAQGVHADGAAQCNPLNITAMSGTFAGTTGSEPSGAGPGHPGNLNFDTPAHGIAATVQVIKNYPAISVALSSGKGLINNPAVSANLSTWSGGGYSVLTG
jgi:hypothetical protein